VDIADFLRARLDEDEALAASGETWSAFDEATQGTRRVDVDHSIERVVACTRSWRGLHIARHDPARVLAEVEAKRRLIDEHKPSRPEYMPRRERGCQTCTTAQEWDTKANEANCLTLRLLALPYADHPAYREEWRP
jgi:hypothetical protein